MIRAMRTRPGPCLNDCQPAAGLSVVSAKRNALFRGLANWLEAVQIPLRGCVFRLQAITQILDRQHIVDSPDAVAGGPDVLPPFPPVGDGTDGVFVLAAEFIQGDDGADQTRRQDIGGRVRQGAVKDIGRHGLDNHLTIAVHGTGFLCVDKARTHINQIRAHDLGGENIPRIDCPNEPFELNDGDILVVASDGLQFLEEDEIAAVLAGAGERPSSVIAQKFLSLLEETADPEQDNASFSVIRVRQEKAQARRRPARRRPANADYPMQGNGKDVPIAAAPSRLTSALFMKGASLFRSISE